MKGRRLEMGPRHAAESISKPEKSGAAYSVQSVELCKSKEGKRKASYICPKNAFPKKKKTKWENRVGVS